MRRVDKLEIGLLVASAFTTAIAVAAFLLSIHNFRVRLDDIQRSRQAAATDTCYVFRRVVIAATIVSHPKQLPAAYNFLASVGLDNCARYGHGIVRLAKR